MNFLDTPGPRRVSRVWSNEIGEAALERPRSGTPVASFRPGVVPQNPALADLARRHRTFAILLVEIAMPIIRAGELSFDE